jgi:predicted RNA-binding protein with PUA-like domain
MPIHYWLLKSEPGSYSIDDLKKDRKTAWTGVRNYQARNFMRDDMKIGDLVLFYHSNAEPPGVAGVARVCSESHPDESAWDENDTHYDPRSTKEKPAWMLVDIEFVEKFKNFVSLEEIKSEPKLAGMLVLKKGQRLSVQPVAKADFERVQKRGNRL